MPLEPPARSGARPGPEEEDAAPGLRVLVVAEDPATCALVRRVVRRDHLLVASDLAAGVELATRTPPDLALVDITLGEGAGLALVHHLKALAPDTIVYAMSGRGTLETAAHAVALGGAGLMMLPLSGDEVLSALGDARQKRAERRIVAELLALRDAPRRQTPAPSNEARLLARAAELGEAESQAAASNALLELLAEITGARKSAVYLFPAEGGSAQLRRVASRDLEQAPLSGTEAEVLRFADQLGLRALPLTVRRRRLGLALGDDELAQNDPDAELLRVVLAQASTALALLAERERATSAATIKDPSSSAYSFAYYADVAGREIHKARRHGRRFAIVTIQVEVAPPPSLRPADPASGLPTPAEIARHVLRAVRDTDVLARVDDGEFHLLLPETDGLGAHACRRRVLGRLVQDPTGSVPGLPLGALVEPPMVGVASFPHDGQNLSQLLRVAKRRGEQTRRSPALRLTADTLGLHDLLARLLEEAERPAETPFALRPFALPIADAAALAGAVVADARRGGSAFIAVSQHDGLCLGAAARAALGPPGDADPNLVFHPLDLRQGKNRESLEALSVLCEQGAYALLARHEGNLLRGVHSADPLLADLLADRLGRAANLRLFG